jgi:hypothetical protein
MSADDARHIRELETRCLLLEQAFLIQEKRIWSRDMLRKLDTGEFMGQASDPEKTQTRQLLRGNLRVGKEILDELANELGYESPTVFKLLDPEFVYGASGEEIPDVLVEQLQKVDSRERESGCSHLQAMFRELKTRHDEFLVEVQQQVRKDVELHALFNELAVE